MASGAAAHALKKQLRELTQHPVPGFHVAVKDDDIFKWEIGIIGPPGTIYQGGYFLCSMNFPQDFPYAPPSFTFNRSFYHPNVYDDGRLCISILHPPGDDPMSGETAAERWNPTQSVESILISIVSLLSDPNCSSPANVDAGVTFRNDRKKYNEIISKQVELSKNDIPAGMTMPKTEADFMVKPPEAADNDEDFWFENEQSEDDEDEDDDDLHDDDDDDDDEYNGSELSEKGEEAEDHSPIKGSK